jgi:hypothetical protein
MSKYENIVEVVGSPIIINKIKFDIETFDFNKNNK